MITVYDPSIKGNPIKQIGTEDMALLGKVAYIDLLSPTTEEEEWVETYTGVSIPSLSEMQEIEPSNRLYIEGDTVYLTATLVVNSSSIEPHTDAATFILTPQMLISVRYSEPQSFALFFSRLTRFKKEQRQPVEILLDFLEASIDRLADILELISHHLDDYSQQIFRPTLEAFISEPDYKRMLQNIGSNGDLGAKVRESLISFERLTSYLSQYSQQKGLNIPQESLYLIRRDIDALKDFTTFIANKASFLLSSTLGMVNIEQNNIIKIFSVAAVIFLPPTLIASIYGMNFSHIPELDWHLGYPISLGLMVFSAWMPYRFFKKKKWL